MMLKSIMHHPVLYIGEIGRVSHYQLLPTHNTQKTVLYDDHNLHLYKFGTSSNIVRREKEHKRYFHQFDLKVLKESNRCLEIEALLRKELSIKRLLLNVSHKNSIQKEIMFLPTLNEKEWVIDFLSDLVSKKYHYNKVIDYRLPW